MVQVVTDLDNYMLYLAGIRFGSDCENPLRCFFSVVRPRRMPEAVKTDSGCYWKTIWKNLYRCGLTLEGS